jgi:hypothetical protein
VLRSFGLAFGAAVPDVQLKLTNAGTGVPVELTTGSDGLFEFVNLKPGVYTLVALKSSFKTFQVSSIRVGANEIYVQNVVMELGTVSERVHVEADPLQVEQTSMQLATTISAKSITDLPLIGRNWITLQQVMPRSSGSGFLAKHAQPKNRGVRREESLLVRSFLVHT